MYIGKEFKPSLLWHFARKNLIRTFLISVAVCALYDFADFKAIAIPFLPIATIGTAVAFYMGFKNNQAYDRLWEARRLWGSITNTSRSFAALVLALIPDRKWQEDLLFRHLAYINVLRLQLRKNIPWATNRESYHRTPVQHAQELGEYEAEVRKLFEAHDKMHVYAMVKDKNNIANGILQYQQSQITQLKHEKMVDAFEHIELTRHITELYNLQGGCERIKTTPLFRQYSVFSRVFVDIFICLLPFALLSEMAKYGVWHVWLTVPFSMLISWVFFTMEQIGEFSENPFDNSLNDIPITTICRNIEIDIKEMMHISPLPPKIEPHDNVLL